MTRQTEVHDRVAGTEARKEKAGELSRTKSETAAKLLLQRAIVEAMPPMRLTQASASIASSTHSMDTCSARGEREAARAHTNATEMEKKVQVEVEVRVGVGVSLPC